MTPQDALNADRPTTDWAAAFNAHNLDKLAALYDTEAVLWGTLTPKLITSASDVRHYFERTFQGTPDIQVTFQETHVRSFGSIAISTGSYVLHLSIGGRPTTLPARFSFTYRRSAQGWLIVDHHASLVPSPLAVPAASARET